MPLYAATVFLSAFLLFLVQPVIARQILPWFGGSAAVWATCLVFFQSVLLAGYAYSDFLIRKLDGRRQLIVHTAMLLLSLAWLPIAPGVHWKPTGDENPMLLILGLLVGTIGLPYLMLSTTSPLIQAWYWRRYESKVPYRLFALSNFASLLALIAYPVAIEPWIPNQGQTTGWSLVYVAFVVLCSATGFASIRAQSKSPAREITITDDPANPAGPAESSGAAGRLTGKQLSTWILLSATGSCLLLTISSHITQNIAAVPFLWVVPLSLYLITFILAFDHPRWYVRPAFLLALAASLPLMAWFMDGHGLWLVGLYTFGMFVGCMFAHGELAKAKPEPRHLTTFYLMMSIGGALGSVLVGILAPLTLPGYYELGILLVLLGVLGIVRVWPEHPILRVVAIGVTVATLVFVGMAFERYTSNTRVMVRNFYGVVRTRDWTEPAPYRAMYHGGIQHGGQLTADAERRRMPSSYFGPTSGYGRLFASLPPGEPKTIGVIGLGAGALAVYAGEHDTIVFYELDPQVAEVAREEFTFLDDVPGEVEVVIGDGRLSLEREDRRGYDVLAIDAFSGDSIPMHLITREAMAVYVEHLEPDGAIVFQATNRYIDIAPVIEKLAAEHGMTALLVSDEPPITEDQRYWLSSTDQIIVTKNPAILAAPAIKQGAVVIEPREGFPAFTDDYTNLLRILK
ncbi:spermidine synthase [Nannocystaceae bacterium ST9]